MLLVSIALRLEDVVIELDIRESVVEELETTCRGKIRLAPPYLT
jgi:hypothetical protein